MQWLFIKFGENNERTNFSERSDDAFRKINSLEEQILDEKRRKIKLMNNIAILVQAVGDILLLLEKNQLVDKTDAKVKNQNIKLMIKDMGICLSHN